MTPKKILVVFGATGNQGGSVINSILSDPITAGQFQITGITRDPSKPSALALAENGVKLVRADLDDKESLRLALKDAYAVFAVTNWQEVLNKEKEIQQGNNVADVAKELKVQHLIWSSLPDVTKISRGIITGVLHFDSKAVVESYIRSLNIPASFLLQGIFMNQIIYFLLPSTSPSGSKSYKFTATVPASTKIPLISAVKDTGKYVKEMLLHPENALGERLYTGEKYYTMVEVADILKRVGGLDVSYEQCTDEAFRESLASVGVPEFLQEDMSQNMKYIQEYGFFQQDLEDSQKFLTEPLETFEAWVANSPEIAALK